MSEMPPEVELDTAPFDAFSVADGLHMNDWGYDCFARNLAAAIVDASAPSAMASAKTGTAH